MSIAMFILIILLLLMTLSSTILSMSYIVFKIKRNLNIKKDNIRIEIQNKIDELKNYKNNVNDPLMLNMLDSQIKDLEKQIPTKKK